MGDKLVVIDSRERLSRSRYTRHKAPTINIQSPPPPRETPAPPPEFPSSLFVDLLAGWAISSLAIGLVVIYEMLWPEPALLFGGGFLLGLTMGAYIRLTAKRG